jgi:transcription elongation factor GreA
VILTQLTPWNRTAIMTIEPPKGGNLCLNVATVSQTMNQEVYYMTAEGLELMKEELDKREQVTRKDITQAIAEAKEQGDLSENFEYQDAKERQAKNEARIIQIRDIMARAVIMESGKGGDTIAMGSTFLVKIGEVEKEFMLVGPTESDPMAGRISHESPLGKAFLGKKAGEKVEIEVPSGTMTYEIVKMVS